MIEKGLKQLPEGAVVCKDCKGTGGVTSRLRHHADCSLREHYHTCDVCGGKGHFTLSDLERCRL